jgi:hypothetical protein
MTTNDTLLFQHVHSNSGCMQWVALTAPRTLEYCRVHEIDYRLLVGDLRGYRGGNGHWTVVELIKDFIIAGYDNVIYFDADCIIANLNADLREACKQDKIGAVWHDLSYHDPDWSHFNVGALYISCSGLVAAFVDEWLSQRPGLPDNPWWEQGVFNRLGRERNIINKLDNRWNAGHVSPSDHPVVLGLHGFPDRYVSMKKRLKELEDATDSR